MNAAYVVEDQWAPPLVLRALWFVFIGLWLGGLVTAAAWALNATIIGLPLGLWIINRIPTIMTLRAIRRSLTDGRYPPAEILRVAERPQAPLLLRAVWFLVVGWWLSAIWAAMAYAAAATIVGLPLAFWMYDRLPAVTTLFRY